MRTRRLIRGTVVRSLALGVIARRAHAPARRGYSVGSPALVEALDALIGVCASVGAHGEAARAALGWRRDLEPSEHEQVALAVWSAEVLARSALQRLAEAVAVVRVADREERAR
jgi:hypothetical protein